MSMDKKKFWEKKIQTWEKDRYGPVRDNSTVDSGTSNIAGSSLRFRFEKAAEILKPYVDDKKILDLGCGTGIFFNELQKTNFSHYTGVDLAESAILEAKKKIEGTEKGRKCSLFSGNIVEFEFPDCEVVVSLGVFDWLDKNEITEIFKKTYPRKFLFSISEKRASITRLVHSIYVYLAYGWKSEGYVPIYYSTDEIIKIAEASGYKNIKIFRHPRLRFGTFLYSLD
jgi:SAM-dependent methyltransferase